MANKVLCPICSELNEVYKVSAIWAGQTVTSSGTTQTYVDGTLHSSPYTETHVSNLARALAPPNRPEAPGTCGLWVGVIAGLILVGFGFLSAFLAGVLVIWGGPTVVSIPSKDWIQAAMMVIFPLSIGVGIIFLAAFRQIKKSKQIKNMLPGWQRAMDRWNELYYCQRDDIIFIRDHKGKYMQVADMKRYLYS